MRQISFACAAAVAALMFGATVIADDANQQGAAEQSLTLEQLIERGRGAFSSNCAACHGSNGEGESGPSLVGNELLSDTNEIARTVINGFSYMPPFGDVLTDVQIASILTYVRTSWGNDYGLVTAEEVAANR